MKRPDELDARKYDAEEQGDLNELNCVIIMHKLSKPRDMEPWNLKALSRDLSMSHANLLRYLHHLENRGFVGYAKLGERKSIITLLEPGRLNLQKYKAWADEIATPNRRF